jgi:predicted O-methyltransferase YrrM
MLKTNNSGLHIEITGWIAQLLDNSELLRMGHSQRSEDLNLGVGWLYYALGRIIRPSKVVIIGSYRGFVPLIFGKALHDNLEPGEVTFIDPSLADDFWKDAQAVQKYFQSFGLENIRHYCMTTQEFVKTEAYRNLGDVGLVFIDGHHSEEQAEFDYEAFVDLLTARGMVLFHDSMVVRPDKVYGAEKAYQMTVKYFVDRLKLNPELELFDVPFGSTGLTLLRKIDKPSSRDLFEWLDGPP